MNSKGSRWTRFFGLVFFFVLSSGFLYSQTSPTVTITDTDTDNLLSASDTVTITATFSEAMVATPTISIASTSTSVLTDFLIYNPEYIITNAGTTTDTATLTSQGEDFGASISISDDGKYMLVGYPLEDDFFSDGTDMSGSTQPQYKPGAAFLYENINGVWTFSQKFNYATARPGIITKNNYQNLYYYRMYGSEPLISGDGNTILIKSFGDRDSDDTYIDVYKKINGSWELSHGGDNSNGNPFITSGSNPEKGFGKSLAVSKDGSFIAIGSTTEFDSTTYSYDENHGEQIGEVRVYMYTPSATNSYTLIGYFAGNDRNGDAINFSGGGLSRTNDLPASIRNDITAWERNNNEYSEEFGIDVSLSSDGSRLAISHASNNSNGTVYVFDYTPSGSTSWTLIGSIDGPDLPAYNQRFGRWAKLSEDGSRLVIGDMPTGTNGGAQPLIYFYDYTPTSSSSSFTLKGKLDANIDQAGQGGNPIIHPGILPSYKISISSDGNKVLIGDEDWVGDAALGQVSLFEYTPTSTSTFTQIGSTVSDTVSSEKEFARGIALTSDGNSFAVGRPDNGGGSVGFFDASPTQKYEYYWDIDSGTTPPDGDYFATVAGTASATSIAYSGTDSITFTLDTTAPTVTLIDTDSNNIVNASEVVTITAIFSETMAATPTISITGIVTNVIMTPVSGTNSYTYAWDTSSGTLSEGTYFATVSGTDLIGNAYVAGTQSITFTVDTTSPTLTITTPSGPKFSSSSLVVTLTYDEAVTGLTTDTSQFSEATNVASLELLSASNDGTTYTLRINP
ncbi:MAG: hypothetical protein L7V85_06070, partial [Bacteroidia bacterium]|nr:hypothetical protein [Bacteroidia bacterium]